MNLKQCETYYAPACPNPTCPNPTFPKLWLKPFCLFPLHMPSQISDAKDLQLTTWYHWRPFSADILNLISHFRTLAKFSQWPPADQIFAFVILFPWVCFNEIVLGNSSNKRCEKVATIFWVPFIKDWMAKLYVERCYCGDKRQHINFLNAKILVHATRQLSR